MKIFINNILTDKKVGGSTLTQQFVKNSILTSEKKYTRKIKEALLAYKLEKRFTKNEILQMYLNESPYGGQNYGIFTAAKSYFNKTPNEGLFGKMLF